MYFSAAASSENDHGSMNLASKTAPVPSTMPSKVAAKKRITGCSTRLWLAGIVLEPKSIKTLGHDAELHDQIARKIFRLGLTALLPPKAEQGTLIVTHDDPGVRAADKASSFSRIRYSLRRRVHRS
jgi:hypothetical protein